MQDEGRKIVHIYCTIIDNYGDVGVCWRLARQLAHEYACAVTLWVDDWSAARQLIAELPIAPAKTAVMGVTIDAWVHVTAQADCIGDVLIEGFACTLPTATLAQLTARHHKPIWVNLDYFSAEAWVPSFHAQSGYDAAVATRRWFFFPGVHEHSGGILREAGLLAQRDQWLAQPTAITAAFLAQWGLGWPQTGLTVLCFAYQHAPYAEWLDALTDVAHSPQPITLWLCGQYSQAAFTRVDKQAHPKVAFCSLPFVPQADFDRLLWCADVLWVRGEDSLARALWSGKPFIWHIYAQADAAHHAKLLAWLAHYTQPFPKNLQVAYIDVHLAWNGLPNAPSFGMAWRCLMQQWQAWRDHSHRRSNEYAEMSDLAQRLMEFTRFREISQNN